ncbi:hypothetical protein, partial [Dokdonella sp.]|uniref:hypothetical protein n=1 Tax=Dokdonella sp. TaxID=2291710 RepID=UPI002BC030E1
VHPGLRAVDLKVSRQEAGRAVNEGSPHQEVPTYCLLEVFLEIPVTSRQKKPSQRIRARVQLE